jgi:hypothetical protein
MAPADAAEVRLMIPDDQVRHLPDAPRIPDRLPPGSVLPRQGDVIYLTSTSAWAVSVVIHELLCGDRVRIEVWLDWVGSARHARDPRCTSTH